MYKIIKIKNSNISINVNNIDYFTYTDNAIIFQLSNNRLHFTVEKSAKQLYNKIEEFILDPNSNLIQIE